MNENSVIKMTKPFPHDRGMTTRTVIMVQLENEVGLLGDSRDRCKEANEAFAGMKLLEIYTTEEQKNLLLQRYPGAKYDSATTGSIELLPKKAKDRLLDLSIKMHTTGPEVTDRFLAEAQS